MLFSFLGRRRPALFNTYIITISCHTGRHVVFRHLLFLLTVTPSTLQCALQISEHSLLHLHMSQMSNIFPSSISLKQHTRILFVSSFTSPLQKPTRTGKPPVKIRQVSSFTLQRSGFESLQRDGWVTRGSLGVQDSADAVN